MSCTKRKGEYRVPETLYRLDGYVSPSVEYPSGIAYEFHGCLYHGCPVCYKNGDDIISPNSSYTASELLARTRQKEKTLKELGMKLVVIWEHEYDNMIRKDLDAKAFVDQLELVDRLDPRDSLMVGRTNGCTLYKRASRGTKIKYVDFTSLYPFVNKMARYQIGHPEIITREFDDITTYFGLAKVKILPTRRLFHPVLGYRSRGKLTFPLCRTCVELGRRKSTDRNLLHARTPQSHRKGISNTQNLRCLSLERNDSVRLVIKDWRTLCALH